MPDLHHGPRQLPGGKTEFRLWAPDCAQPSLLLQGQPAQRMRAQGDGFHSCIADCGPGTAYRFEVRPGLAVPDPASRCQRGGVHGWSIVTADSGYAWQNPDWRGRPWEETVIYELHAGLCGGFAGVQAQLPRLHALGVTAIELMPIGEFSGERNWGYDGVLPYAPHAAYGEPDALRRLVDAAHALGLCVYLDVVYNHFGPDGNYLHEYASRFFRKDRPTPWGEAIDFREPAVREFFIGNALYWTREFRIDGLRFDAVHAINDEAFLREMAQRLRAAAGPQRQLHLMLENEHNQARLLEGGSYDAQWNDDGHNVLHHLLTGETEAYYGAYREEPVHKLARCLGEGFIYQGETPPGASHGRGEPSGHLPPARFILFLQNHDQVGNRALGERLLKLCSEPALRAATLALLLSPQVPLLFMGEEWGCEQPFLFFTAFGPELAQKVCEGRRQEFSRFKAFTDAGARARIPDPNDQGTYRQSAPDFGGVRSPRQDAWLAYYRELLELRRTRLAPHLAGARALGAAVIGERAVQAAWRLGDGSRLSLLLNLAGASTALPAPPAGELLAQSREGVRSALAQCELPEHSAAVLLGAAP